VTNTIFGRWELVVADDVYIRNGSGTNIGAQTYNTYQYMKMCILHDEKKFGKQQKCYIILECPLHYIDIVFWSKQTYYDAITSLFFVRSSCRTCS